MYLIMNETIIEKTKPVRSMLKCFTANAGGLGDPAYERPIRQRKNRMIFR